MDEKPMLVMSFATLDEAESALDWIGVDFVDAEGGFEGRLDADDRDLLDAAEGDPESPLPVVDLARALRELLDADADTDPSAGAAWRVAYEA